MISLSEGKTFVADATRRIAFTECLQCNRSLKSIFPHFVTAKSTTHPIKPSGGLHFKKQYSVATPSSEDDTEIKIQGLAEEKFLDHPFSTQVTAENSQRVSEAYFAMSQAFPFIQAGAYQNIILRAIKRNLQICPEVEKTFVVGSFLCWDETGGG